MADYIEPTQEEFDAAEAVVLDTMSTRCSGLMTKSGAVVRELVVRPMAYLYSWCAANLEDIRKKTSVSYLKTSTATENSIADDVASNYFVARNEGTKSSGVVTLTLNRATVSLVAGSAFTAAGTTLVTEKTCVMSTGVVSDSASNVIYITVFQTLDSTGATVWLANVPVVAQTTGKIEIAAGTKAVPAFASSYIKDAELTSAVTGGSDAETDAEMMERCRLNTAESGIGSYNGLRKKLNSCPVHVSGMSVVAGDDKPLFRARYNNTNINPGGFVDCYVKTQDQASTGTIIVDLTSQEVTKTTVPGVGTRYSFPVSGQEYAGFISVTGLRTDKTGPVSSFTTSFGSSDGQMDADGARLSVHQTCTVEFVSLYNNETEARVTVDYMPSIYSVDSYMNGAYGKFIGQDVCVKSAVPVMLSLQCPVYCDTALTSSEMATLTKAVADYVNNMPVGDGTINFSDIREVCASALPKATLRLPCELTAYMYTRDCGRDVQSSSTGVLDITCPVSKAFWNSEQSFFCTTEAQIRLEQE